jgi:hypothetical protein
VLNPAQGVAAQAPLLVLHLELEEFSQLFDTVDHSTGLVRLRATLGRAAGRVGVQELVAQRGFVVQRVADGADAGGRCARAYSGGGRGHCRSGAMAGAGARGAAVPTHVVQRGAPVERRQRQNRLVQLGKQACDTAARLTGLGTVPSRVKRRNLATMVAASITSSLWPDTMISAPA